MSTTPAKVARIGKAHQPLLQDENSGREGRRYNEWLANRADSRLRAREASNEIADETDERAKKGTVVALAVTAMVICPLLVIGVVSLVAHLVRN